MKTENNLLFVRHSNLELLYKVYPILKVIDEKSNRIISEHAQFKILRAGEHISSENSTCQGILFVLKGSIKVQRINIDGEETNLYDIKEGDLCHEALSCSLQYKPLNILGIALQDSNICVMPMETVKKYLLNDNDFLSYMYKDIYIKFGTIIEKKEEKNHKSIEKRLINLLLRKNSKIIYGTHRQLAFEIDSSREVVSRKLKDIEKQGYIKLERGKIVIIKDLHGILKSD